MTATFAQQIHDQLLFGEEMPEVSGDYEEYLEWFKNVQHTNWINHLKDVISGQADFITFADWIRDEEDPISYDTWCEIVEEDWQDRMADIKYEEHKERLLEEQYA